MPRFKVKVFAWAAVSTQLNISARNRGEAECRAMDAVESAEAGSFNWTEEPGVELDAKAEEVSDGNC